MRVLIDLITYVAARYGHSECCHYCTKLFAGVLNSRTTRKVFVQIQQNSFLAITLACWRSWSCCSALFIETQNFIYTRFKSLQEPFSNIPASFQRHISNAISIISCGFAIKPKPSKMWIEKETEKKNIQLMFQHSIIANNLLCARTRTRAFPISLHCDFELFTFMSNFWCVIKRCGWHIQHQIIRTCFSGRIWTLYLIELLLPTKIRIFDAYMNAGWAAFSKKQRRKGHLRYSFCKSTLDQGKCDRFEFTQACSIGGSCQRPYIPAEKSRLFHLLVWLYCTRLLVAKITKKCLTELNRFHNSQCESC